MNLPHVVTLESLNNLSQVISSPPFPLFPPPPSLSSSSSSSSTTHPVVGTWIILSTVLFLNNKSHHIEEHSEGEGGGRGETEWIITVGQNHHLHRSGQGGGGQGKDEWWEVRMNHSKVLKLIQDTKAKLPIQGMIDRIVSAFSIPTALVLSFPPAASSSSSSASSTPLSNIGFSILATPSVTLNLVLIPRPIDQLAVSLISLLATSIPSLNNVTSALLAATTATQLLDTIVKERDRALAKLRLLESSTTSSFSSSQRHNNNGSPSGVKNGRKTWKSMKEKEEEEEEEEEDEELRLKFEKEEEWNTGEEGSGAIKSEPDSGTMRVGGGGHKRVKREENGLAQGVVSRRIAKHRPEISNNGHGGKSGGGVVGARGKIVERPSLDDDPFG